MVYFFFQKFRNLDPLPGKNSEATEMSNLTIGSYTAMKFSYYQNRDGELCCKTVKIDENTCKIFINKTTASMLVIWQSPLRSGPTSNRQFHDVTIVKYLSSQSYLHINSGQICDRGRLTFHVSLVQLKKNSYLPIFSNFFSQT